MKKTLIMIVAVSAMLLVTACVQTHGNASVTDRKTTAKIKNGYSQSQVRSILGDPTSTMMLKNGEQWTYTYSEAKFNAGSYMAKAVTMGQAGGNMISGQRNIIYTVKFNMSGRVISKKYGY